MRIFLKKVALHGVRPLLLRYLSRERGYRYRGLQLKIRPGVFHPGFFFSTKFLVSQLSEMDLGGKNLLELGAGSGMISLFCARAGARVTASDISATAVANIAENAQRNAIELTVLESDLFEKIPRQRFEVIVINPPYYPRNPQNESQRAWYCGDDFQYFRRLFPQLHEYSDAGSRVLMVLSEDCDLEKIKEIAAENNFEMVVEVKRRIWWEMNYIFRVVERWRD